MGIKDGDTLDIEKAKIALTVKMPHGMDDVKVVVDPKIDDADKIRQQILEATGLPMQYQQRLKFGDELLDDGYDQDGDGANGDKPKKRKLGEFDGLKEFCDITLEPTRIYIMRMPETEQFTIEEVNPMKDILQDLKKVSIRSQCSRP